MIKFFTPNSPAENLVINISSIRLNGNLILELKNGRLFQTSRDSMQLADGSYLKVNTPKGTLEQISNDEISESLKDKLRTYRESNRISDGYAIQKIGMDLHGVYFRRAEGYTELLMTFNKQDLDELIKD